MKKMNCGTKKLSLAQRFVVRTSPRKSGPWVVKTAHVHPLENMLSRLPPFSSSGGLKYTSGKIHELSFAPQHLHHEPKTETKKHCDWDPSSACSALNRCAVVSSAFTKLLEPQRSSLGLMKQFPQLHVGSQLKMN